MQPIKSVEVQPQHPNYTVNHGAPQSSTVPYPHAPAAAVAQGGQGGVVTAAIVPGYTDPFASRYPSVEMLPPDSTAILTIPRHPRPWSSGLLHCVDDTPSIVEVLFCHWCQVSRQYNLITYGSNDVNWQVLLIQLLIDAAAGGIWFGLGTFAMTWHVRDLLRKRYAIEGDTIDDCLTTFFCHPCAQCQMYREMSVQGDWPSGHCVQGPYLGLHRPPAVAVMQPRQPQNFHAIAVVKA